MNDEIGRKMRVLRRGRKLTQQELADRMGLARATVSNYEVGRRSPHLSELKRFADFYGVGLDYFGVSPADEVFDLVGRAKKVFESEAVPKEKKEELYKEFMKLYLNMK